MSDWQRYRQYLLYDPPSGLALDLSGIDFADRFFPAIEERLQGAYSKMAALENGAAGNVDEGRMVGHYWLRAPHLAPNAQIKEAVIACQEAIKLFASHTHAGEICGEGGEKLCNVLLIGIGGSSLGPAFVSEALSSTQDKMKLFFMDNTDPDGMDRLFAMLDGGWNKTLVLVVSKSGSTLETRNGMKEVAECYRKKGLSFAAHAIAITMEGSKLHLQAQEEGWLAFFPLWDWVGGRTSLFSAVGLLPLALQGVDVDELLAGAARGDILSRRLETKENPAALLAAAWYQVTGGQSGFEMVVLPYKDRLLLLGRYLQQLVMESLGKKYDLQGQAVYQGLSVFGNKGSSDQHSYLQQLLSGPDNFLVVFIEILRDRAGKSVMVGESSTSGDYLQAFLLGTAEALSACDRNHLIITLPVVDGCRLGLLLALFERAVGFYAHLINVNPYHQPAVEMGKKSAASLIVLKNRVLKELRANSGKWYDVGELAGVLSERERRTELWRLLWHLSSNDSYGIEMKMAEDLTGSCFRYYQP